jgi:hypothetical protein
MIAAQWFLQRWLADFSGVLKPDAQKSVLETDETNNGLEDGPLRYPIKTLSPHQHGVPTCLKRFPLV